MAKYELNVAVKDGLDWTGKAPRFVHFVLVQLGDNLSEAAEKADLIMQKFGKEDYSFSFRTIETHTFLENL